MEDVRTQPLVWVKDNAGNRFLCPLDALMDPNSVNEEEKRRCVEDASKLKGAPGDKKIVWQIGKPELVRVDFIETQRARS